MFVRYENFGQFVRLYPIVTVLIAINLLFYLFSVLTPELYYRTVYLFGVGWNEAVAHGQWWRLVTPIFLHGGLGHFVFNSFGLIIFGPALERMVGKFKFIGAYMFAGIAGNVGTFLFETGHYLHLGASGAIYGLLGIYFYMRFFRLDLIDAQSAQVVIVMLIIGAIHTFVVQGINILGHLFGFIGGTVIAPVVFMGKTKYFRTFTSAPRSTQDESVATFDPMRWKKKRKRNEKIKVTFWIILGILVLIGLFSQLFS